MTGSKLWHAATRREVVRSMPSYSQGSERGIQGLYPLRFLMQPPPVPRGSLIIQHRAACMQRHCVVSTRRQAGCLLSAAWMEQSGPW